MNYAKKSNDTTANIVHKRSNYALPTASHCRRCNSTVISVQQGYNDVKMMKTNYCINKIQLNFYYICIFFRIVYPTPTGGDMYATFYLYNSCEDGSEYNMSEDDCYSESRAKH